MDVKRRRCAFSIHKNEKRASLDSKEAERKISQSKRTNIVRGRQTEFDHLRWLNTVLRAVSGNSRDGECFNLDKQTWRRKSNGRQKTISQNLVIKIL